MNFFGCRRYFHRFVMAPVALVVSLSSMPSAMAADGVGPVVAVNSPAQNAVLSSTPIIVSASATDIDGIVSTFVAVRNRATGLWLRIDSSWGAYQKLPATMSAPIGSTTTSFSWTYPLTSGSYYVQTLAYDSGNTKGEGPDRFVTLQIAPTVTISTPTSNQVFTSSPVSFGGASNDDLGVISVKYAVQNTTTLQWWDGSVFGALTTELNGVLSNPGATFTAWTASMPAAAGSYRIEGRAIDSSGLTSPTISVNFSLIDPPPSIAITAPTEGQTIATSPVVASGTAADDTAVASVNVSIQDTNTNQWWNGTTWSAAPTQFAAQIASPGSSATSWSFAWLAPTNGTFRFNAVAIDNISQSSTTATVSFGLSDAPPDATITTPTAGQVIANAPIAIGGTATDDVSVTGARITIQDLGTLQYWNGTAWGAIRFEIPSALATPGATSTSWSYAWEPTVFGDFRVEAWALDSLAHSSTIRTRDFSYRDDAPIVAILNPSAGATLAAAPITFSGTASDDLAVDAVKVAIQNSSTSLWWDGSAWGASRVEFTANLSSPGNAETNWTYIWSPPAFGSFAVEARSTDSLSQHSTLAAATFAYLDSPPSVVISTPTAGQTVTSIPVNITGSATDDAGIIDTRVAIQDLTTSLWWTGTAWSGTRTELTATLTSPNAQSTSWQYMWSVPQNGSYRVESTATDSAANSSSLATRDFVFLDAIPTIQVSSPTQLQAFSTTPIALLGSANDDLGVSKVTHAVRQDSTSLWLQSNGTWASTRVEFDLAMASPGATTSAWSGNFAPPSAGQYTVEFQATDSGLQTSALSTAAFTYDDLPPTVTVSSPATNQSFVSASVGFGGTAADDRAVTNVFVAIANVSGQYWNGSNFASSRIEFPATLAAAGTTFTTWSHGWTAPAFGSYVVEATTADDTGHRSPTTSVPFSYTDLPPAITIAIPTTNQVFQSQQVSFGGAATDDLGVASARLTIRDSATGEWLQAPNSWGNAPVEFFATLTVPNTPSTLWQHTTALGRYGTFVVSATAVDTTTNISPATAVSFKQVKPFQSNRTTTWSTNGNAYTVASDGANRLYVGGEFDQVGPTQGGGVVVDPSSGLIGGNTAALVGGKVLSAAQDGAGGWYIGGDFSLVGDKYRRGLAHILSNGALDPSFSPRPNGTVHAVVYDAPRNRVYLGGNFTTVQQLAASRIAAVDAVTGTLVSGWTGNANNNVRALALSPSGDTLYAGGDFTKMNSTTRTRMAALNPTTGALTSFVAGASSTVHEILPDSAGTTIYVAGAFTTLAGSTRNRIGAVGTSGTLVSSFNPNANGIVYGLARSLDGTSIYAAGAFTSIGGQSRNYLASLTVGGTADIFDATVTGIVRDVTVESSGSLLVAGDFISVGATPRNRVARVNSDSSLSTWNPNASDVSYVARPNSSGTGVLIGGAFSFVGGTSRRNLAAFDLSASGAVVNAWQADADGPVWTLLAHTATDSLYLGGDFANVAGVSRSRVAKLSMTSGVLNSGFVANADAIVRHIEVGPDSKVYIGGSFTTINNVHSGRLTRVNATTGARDASWQSTPDARVNGFVISNDAQTIYVTGQFTSIGGSARRGLGAVNLSTGLATSWNPGVLVTGSINGYDLTLDPTGSEVYFAAGGGFNGGGNSFYKLSATTGAMLWKHFGDGDAQAVYYYGGMVYGGHHYDIIDYTTSRQRAVNFDAATGVIAPWDPQGDSQLGVWDFTMTPFGLVAAGEFTRFGGESQRSIALFAWQT